MAKKKRRRSGMPIIIVLLVILLVLIGGGTYFYINGNRLMLPGEWGREIDITDQVRYEAKEYIESAAFGDEIDIAEFIPEVKLNTVLVVSKDGEIAEVVSEEDYNQMTLACQTGLENAIRELISRRIKDNYIETDMSVDDLIQETFKTSLTDYLKQYGPKLLPDYSELDSEYGMSAFYKATKDEITIQGTDGSETVCNYAVTHGMLVIDYSDGAVVYYER